MLISSFFVLNVFCFIECLLEANNMGSSTSRMFYTQQKLRNLGIKPDIVHIIFNWEQEVYKSKHVKFRRTVSAENGNILNQILCCSCSSSDYQWARVVSRDFLKREKEKDLFLELNKNISQ